MRRFGALLLLAALATRVDELVDVGTHLVLGELALRDEVGRELARLGAAHLGELRSGVERALPVGDRGHGYLF